MASKSPNKEYMIFRPERIGLLDILSLLFLRRNLASYKFVDSQSVELENVRFDWITALILLVQKFLLAISKPLQKFGNIVELVLNFVSLNGGILRIIWKFITGSIVIPDSKAANYRSIIAFIDDRLDLYTSKSLMDKISLIELEEGLGSGVTLSEITMMASKIAYENSAYIEEAVTKHWKMNFVGFYNCWNIFLKDYTTQAFIFCDKEKDANFIFLAFRGTEPFNARDWATDIELSWLSMGKLGHVHIGFLKALGLQDETDYQKGFPVEINEKPNQPIAYYTLREELKTLLKKHTNAKIVVTGHSLGGALAVIFPSLLAMHNQSDVLGSLHGVLTFGQPRVGDAKYGEYVESFVASRYYRMVYRYDIVPRIPFDYPPIALFKHCGTCVYYDGWYERKVVEEVPNPNYFDPKYIASMYFNAWGDLIKGIFIGKTQGKDYKEGIVSILYRSAGLILPGIASHSPRDYVNAGRLSKTKTKEAFP